MSNVLYWVKGLGITISGAIVFFGNSAIATFSYYPTSMNNCRVATQENIRIIESGIKSKSNFFLSVPTGNITDFNNSTSLNVDSSLVASTVRNLNFADGTRHNAAVFQNQNFLLATSQGCPNSTCTCWDKILKQWVAC